MPKLLVTYGISLERYFQDLSNGILHALNFQAFKLVDQKNRHALEFLSSICPTLFGETCKCRFQGLGKVYLVSLTSYGMMNAHSGKSCILSSRNKFINCFL
jgi:hypothetical protein